MQQSVLEIPCYQGYPVEYSFRFAYDLFDQLFPSAGSHTSVLKSRSNVSFHVAFAEILKTYPAICAESCLERDFFST